MANSIIGAHGSTGAGCTALGATETGADWAYVSSSSSRSSSADVTASYDPVSS